MQVICQKLYLNQLFNTPLSRTLTSLAISLIPTLATLYQSFKGRAKIPKSVEDYAKVKTIFYLMESKIKHIVFKYRDSSTNITSIFLIFDGTSNGYTHASIRPKSFDQIEKVIRSLGSGKPEVKKILKSLEDEKSRIVKEKVFDLLITNIEQIKNVDAKIYDDLKNQIPSKEEKKEDTSDSLYDDDNVTVQSNAQDNSDSINHLLVTQFKPVKIPKATFINILNVNMIKTILKSEKKIVQAIQKIEDEIGNDDIDPRSRAALNILIPSTVLISSCRKEAKAHKMPSIADVVKPAFKTLAFTFLGIFFLSYVVKRC